MLAAQYCIITPHACSFWIYYTPRNIHFVPQICTTVWYVVFCRKYDITCGILRCIHRDSFNRNRVIITGKSAQLQAIDPEGTTNWSIPRSHSKRDEPRISPDTIFAGHLEALHRALYNVPKPLDIVTNLVLLDSAAPGSIVDGPNFHLNHPVVFVCVYTRFVQQWTHSALLNFPLFKFMDLSCYNLWNVQG